MGKNPNRKSSKKARAQHFSLRRANGDISERRSTLERAYEDFDNIVVANTIIARRNVELRNELDERKSFDAVHAVEQEQLLQQQQQQHQQQLQQLQQRHHQQLQQLQDRVSPLEEEVRREKLRADAAEL